MSKHTEPTPLQEAVLSALNQLGVRGAIDQQGYLMEIIPNERNRAWPYFKPGDKKPTYYVPSNTLNALIRHGYIIWDHNLATEGITRGYRISYSAKQYLEAKEQS